MISIDLLIAGGLLAMSFSGMSSHAGPPSPDYVLLYEDNFEGNAVNEVDWSYRLGRREGGGYINGLNLKENVSVSDGALHIAVRQEMIDGELENTGGGLISKHQFGYGYYETLSRPFMAGRGVHSSFWQAGGVQPNNGIFEIDSYEIDSKTFMGCNNLYVHISPQGYKAVPWPCRANVPFAFRSDGWLLDAYEYTPDGVIFYDNGREVARAEWNELTAAQKVWLTALNGCGKVDGDALPGETVFKYFRYYARDYPGVNLLPNGSFEYNQDKVDSEKPVAWQQEGTPGAGRVVEGDAARDQYKIRHGSTDGPFEVVTRQSLEFILNGDYELSAMVRSSGGQQVARFGASDFGDQDLFLDVPATENWTRVSIPKVSVSTHGVTVVIESKGQVGQWLEIDDVQFTSPPSSGQVVRRPADFALVGDPIWKIGMTHTIKFTGDDKFYFFDRNVGRGDAITVSFLMNPDLAADMSPIARIPKTGNAGWAVQLTEAGGIIFRIGSGEKHVDVLAPDAYEVGKACRITCVFDRGEARIYGDGKLLKTQRGIEKTTDDATAPGRMGSVGEIYQVVGDVIARTETFESPEETAGAAITRKYTGTLREIRIHNRALREDEVRNLDGNP
ncbi:family 16 glycosylhydrolase [bacterium]|nr:family 16 glycosylhydrolase [bacterium]